MDGGPFPEEQEGSRSFVASATAAPTTVIPYAASSASGARHFGKECPQNPRNGSPGGAARARLKPAVVARAPVKDRLVFPAPAARMEHLPLSDPARRTHESNKVIVASPTQEIEEHIMRQHVVTLTPADHSHSASPAAVGRAIFELLSTPPHQLRVNAHQPEAFLVHFNLPAHQDNTVHYGVIKVEGCKYFIRAWREEDHAAILKFNYHVCIVVEGLSV
ncbi:hypothetical protein D1007_20990 [Hordeum vulgare]|nr:hypothetical protein D1007_20990 [Hordeum vulgare]